MKKILFICHGNICRSPMAEFVMKDMATKAGAGERFVIDSAATSTEELGNPVYPPARRELAAHGVFCGPHTARQMTRADYNKYDLLIGMDSANIRNMTRIPTNLHCAVLLSHHAHHRRHRPPRRRGRPVVHG